MPSELLRNARRNPGLLTGAVMLGLLIVVAALAPPQLGEAAGAMGVRAAAPSTDHWLGTDAAGHDMLARSLVATRLTLLMTVGAAALSVVIGAPPG